MGAGHYRVLRMLREEHAREQARRLAEKHVDMFRILEMVILSRKKHDAIHSPSLLEDVISFCSLFRPVGFIPEEVTPAEYYSLAYMLYDLVMEAYSRGLVDYELRKDAVTALLDHVRWAEKEFGKRGG